MVVTSENGLWIFVPVMTALALAGLILAARVEEGMFHYAGFALLAVSVLWIFLGLKGYYDAKERQQPQH
jgi:heme A synthase